MKYMFGSMCAYLGWHMVNHGNTYDNISHPRLQGQMKDVSYKHLESTILANLAEVGAPITANLSRKFIPLYISCTFINMFLF